VITTDASLFKGKSSNHQVADRLFIGRPSKVSKWLWKVSEFDAEPIANFNNRATGLSQQSIIAV
jgi:hypothetical protein